MFSARREGSNPPRGMGMDVDVGMDMGGGTRWQGSPPAMAGGDSE